MKIEIKLLTLFTAVLLCSNMQRPAPINETKADHQKIVILAIDGGGIKGYYAAHGHKGVEPFLKQFAGSTFKLSDASEKIRLLYFAPGGFVHGLWPKLLIMSPQYDI